LFYATGTSDKALLNSTWGTSPNDIQRANKTELQNTGGSYEESILGCAFMRLNKQGKEMIMKNLTKVD